MTGLELALAAFALMLIAIFLRVPIGVAMAGAGFVGTWMVLGHPSATLSQLKTLTYDTFKNYNLSIVPLFLLMGQFATKSGMSGALFQAASDWLGHRKGGVAMAAVHRREILPAGFAADGPAVIESLESTVLVRPGWTLRVDADGFLHMERAVNPLPRNRREPSAKPVRRYRVGSDIGATGAARGTAGAEAPHVRPIRKAFR